MLRHVQDMTPHTRFENAIDREEAALAQSDDY
jgi:hypothetical protein